jgi:hypothetical protein
MSLTAKYPTPYPYVNEVVELLLKNVRAVLGDYFVGLYLYGSLASGDFDPGQSDIDWLVVTTEELPEKIYPALKSMHKRIWVSGLEWAPKLEGTYFPKYSMYRHNSADPPRPHVNEGKFSIIRHASNWVINYHILREKGVVVAGLPIRPLIAPVSRDELRDAVVTSIIDGWTPLKYKRNWLVPPCHQPYIVLTCCRALYTLRYGTIKSKPVSARWALKTLDNRWKDLIKNAMAWQFGMPPGDIEKTLKMVRYVLGKVTSYAARPERSP